MELSPFGTVIITGRQAFKPLASTDDSVDYSDLLKVKPCNDRGSKNQALELDPERQIGIGKGIIGQEFLLLTEQFSFSSEEKQACKNRDYASRYSL